MKKNIKKEKEEPDYLKKYIKYLIISLISFIILYELFNILELSYYSTIVGESNNIQQTLKDYKITEAGSLEITYNLNCSILNWTIHIEDENDIKTLKHEFCHLKQHMRVNEINCYEKRKFLYFHELECYAVENLPNFIYNRYYYDIKKIKEKN